jgi:hypothetical protein
MADSDVSAIGLKRLGGVAAGDNSGDEDGLMQWLSYS